MISHTNLNSTQFTEPLHCTLLLYIGEVKYKSTISASVMLGTLPG